MTDKIVEWVFFTIHIVIFPDWVGEIHIAQLQRLDRRQRTRIPKVLL